MLHYIGVVQLPSKQDYWSSNYPYMPINPTARELDMTQDQFMFMWQNFHIYDVSDIDMLQEESNGEEENSNNIVEFDLECVQHDQGNSDSADESIEEEDNSNESGKDPEDKSDTV
eukprot:13598124-Ditylum_brightwellii.AAC.1